MLESVLAQSLTKSSTFHTARQILVVAADLRVPVPSSTIESVLGDGAVAVLVADSDVAASVEDSYSVSDEILDFWREEGHSSVRFWEDRFNIDIGVTHNLGGYPAIAIVSVAVFGRRD